MSLKDFQIISKLGEGAYSTVYKVYRVEDNMIYALKRVKIINLSSKQKQNALNQIRILASIRHPTVICYKEAFIDEPTKSLCIVMEFASHGDLSKKISELIKNGQFLAESTIWNLFIQIVKGLKQLHDLKILHRDIKPANVFIHEGELAKLGDMNVSKVTERGLCMTQTGTPYYASPEVWKDQPYNEKSDIWSLGCVLYELIVLKPPFQGQDMEELFKKVTRGIYSRIPQNYSQDLSTLIRSLLQTNPDLRPSCEKILKSAIVQKKLRHYLNDSSEMAQLLKTIKPTDNNFYSIAEHLPKPNYVPVKVKKAKGIQSLIDSLQAKQLCEVESLPFLEKQKKIMPNQHSERIPNKDKHSLNIARDRKKSQIQSTSITGLEINGINYKLDEGKEFKLPKVQNRYNKIQERVGKQNSLRCHQPIDN